jgi:hypothetical protein
MSIPEPCVMNQPNRGGEVDLAEESPSHDLSRTSIAIEPVAAVERLTPHRVPGR